MSTTTPTALTDPEIDLLVERYTREMARYEEVATLVERRLQRELRASAVRALLSSRAKHPEDLRGKLGRKRSDARYGFSTLDKTLNTAITDLAGYRVMVYRLADIERVERVILDAFELAALPNAFEQHEKKDTGYRATHLLLRIGDAEERLSLRGAICEVQVASLAAHVFNELEHDIGYKDHDCPPTAPEQEALGDVRAASRLLDRSVESLLTRRAEAVRKQTVPLKDAEELQLLLEHEANRRLYGEFVRLFRLMNAVIQPLTAAALAGLGSVEQLLQKGAQRAEELSLPDANDVVHMALALSDRYADEFADLVRSQRGPATLLKKAILKAAEERKRSS